MNTKHYTGNHVRRPQEIADAVTGMSKWISEHLSDPGVGQEQILLACGGLAALTWILNVPDPYSENSNTQLDMFAAAGKLIRRAENAQN